MRKLAVPRGNSRSNRAVWIQRIHALNRIFESRYRGQVFPDDDAGIDDLKILIHHYYWGNPIAMPRIIKLRAPWANAEALIAEVNDNPKKWNSVELGKEINFTGREWRQLHVRTITPVDMSKAERDKFNRIRANERRRVKRKREGMVTRAEYLERNNLSQTRPWETEGVSKATWYRRRTKRETGAAHIKFKSEDQTCLNKAGPKKEEREKRQELHLAAQLPASPDQYQDPSFNPILSWLCLRAAYHQQMNKICDQVANAQAA
jgi:hypothetical protein